MNSRGDRRTLDFSKQKMFFFPHRTFEIQNVARQV